MEYKEEYSNSTIREGIKYKILKRLCLGNGLFRAVFYKYINKYEGGQFYSKTLRKIYRDTYDIDVGVGTYGCFTSGIRSHCKIGNYCSIAPGVQRLVGNHPFTEVSTHPLFYKREFGNVETTRYDYHSLVIGNDVWIGVNAIITSSCTFIGNGAVIGAGAVVTHNVPDYAIVVGVPAKVIKYRFDKNTINELLEIKWWDRNPIELREIAKYSSNINEFIERYKSIFIN